MIEHSIGTILTDATKTTVYTVPTGYYAKWNLSYIMNSGANSKSISSIWHDISKDIELFVLSDKSVASKEFLKFDGGAYVVLDEGDHIYAQAEADSSFHLINTFELIRK